MSDLSARGEPATPEATRQALDAAVRAWVDAQNPGQIVIDWVMVAASASLEDMEEEQTTYEQATRQGQATHVTAGLLAKATFHIWEI